MLSFLAGSTSLLIQHSSLLRHSSPFVIECYLSHFLRHPAAGAFITTQFQANEQISQVLNLEFFWHHQPALHHTQVMPSSTHRVWPQQWCKQNRLAHLRHFCTAKVTKKISRQILYCPLPLIMLEFDPCQYYKISIFFTHAQSPPHLITNGTHLRCIGLAPQVRQQSNACLRTRARVYYTRQTSGSGTARQMISPDARTNFSDAPTNQL